MEGKHSRFIKIGCIQIFVYTLLHEPRSAHVNPIYNPFPGSVLQYGIYQTIRVASPLHIN